MKRKSDCRITVSAAQLARYKKQAKRAGITLREWACDWLDSGAQTDAETPTKKLRQLVHGEDIDP